MIGRLLRPLRSGTAKLASNDPRLSARATLDVTSAAFASGTMMPASYRGKDAIFPPIAWGGVPPEAREFVLIAEDVDVPFPAPLVHTIVYGIAAERRGFDAGGIPKMGPKTPDRSDGVSLGRAFGLFPGYGAPTPIPGHGPHRYVYQVFALDTSLPRFAKPPSKAAIVAAMSGRVVARGAVIGLAES